MISATGKRSCLENLKHQTRQTVDQGHATNAWYNLG